MATGSVELTSKLWEFYRDSHNWDVPAEVGLGTVNRYFLSDEARAFGALVLRDNIQQAEKEGKKGEIIAFAVSYHPLRLTLPPRWSMRILRLRFCSDMTCRTKARSRLLCSFFAVDGAVPGVG